ncbi:TOBE domain-containing protein [Campylobacter gastrosuis]|uniref:TOBE domain-containing protein n=1 Tax=Campylobacter gastrosuis TaxID=2974576 RepID=A0ABT7HR98_9BACT|nr:TOBE domain-containing protein [Campylobacter gastrosuis]MDL0089436.1 TOBE domain-containing protein [Campylobacter gastrosuis]
MAISARNQLKVKIADVKTGAVNSLITAKLNGKETLKATITIDSEKNLGIKAGLDAVFLFKASSVLIATNDELKLSATNQLNGVVKSVKDGLVNSEIIIDINGDEISAIITKESATRLNLKSGDSVKAIIKATNIIVGVK